MIGVGIPGGGYRLSKGLAGMVKNKEHSESSTMKPLCWPLFLRTSKLEVAPGVGCMGSRANTGLPVSLVMFKPTSPLCTQPSGAVFSFSSLQDFCILSSER